MNSRTADANCVTIDIPTVVQPTKAGLLWDVRRDGIPVKYIGPTMRISALGTECADFSRGPILQQYLRSGAIVSSQCAQRMATMTKASFG